ncbi:MAG TPA: hypothetical protein VE445_00530 [Nitrososphaeraceae archaeon]|nr:hypothetical protein [Nitrososphaeraceae archaeon]
MSISSPSRLSTSIFEIPSHMKMPGCNTRLFGGECWDEDHE